jgi:hypothetical protein
MQPDPGGKPFRLAVDAFPVVHAPRQAQLLSGKIFCKERQLPRRFCLPARRRFLFDAKHFYGKPRKTLHPAQHREWH